MNYTLPLDSQAVSDLSMKSYVNSKICIIETTPRRYRLLLQEMHIPVGGDMRESNTILIFWKKEAAVKIAINEELSKAVIKPIKLFGISGQWDIFFPICLF